MLKYFNTYAWVPETEILDLCCVQIHKPKKNSRERRAVLLHVVGAHKCLEVEFVFFALSRCSWIDDVLLRGPDTSRYRYGTGQRYRVCGAAQRDQGAEVQNNYGKKEPKCPEW